MPQKLVNPAVAGDFRILRRYRCFSFSSDFYLSAVARLIWHRRPISFGPLLFLRFIWLLAYRCDHVSIHAAFVDFLARVDSPWRVICGWC